MTTGVPTLGVLTIAGMAASTPFGIPMEQVAIGTGFAVVGVIGRASFELQKASEGSKDGIQAGKILGWVGSGLIGAPFVTIMYMIVLSLAGIKSDGVVSLGLLFLGFSGPRMVTWLLSTGISLINKRTGLNIPILGGSAPTGTPPGKGP